MSEHEKEQAIETWLASMPAPTHERVTCQHEQFMVFAGVNRFADTGRFLCELHIWCAQCREPFRFMGLTPGLSFVEPSCSIDGLEAMLPLEPEGVKQLFAGARYQVPPKEERH